MIICKYAVSKASSINDLEMGVNALIKFGWQPFGTVVVSETNYFQTMIKTNDTSST